MWLDRIVSLTGIMLASAPPPDGNGGLSGEAKENYDLARKSWQAYVQLMIGSDGFPFMLQGQHHTTSEAASYMLLQAVIMDDFATFDKVLAWTEKHLQRPDKLFGWEWKNGTFTKNGTDPSSDADQDIAAALILAWKKTGKEPYKTKALSILKALWQKEVVTLNNGKLLLTAGTQQALYLTDRNNKKVYGVNPSYFRPTYYTALFPEIDPTHPWQRLVETSYEYIEKSADAALYGPKKGSSNLNAQMIQGDKNLPPDFIAVRPDGSITDHRWNEKQDFCFDGDAWRILFWMSLQNNFDPKDPFSKRFLSEQAGSVRDAGPLHFLKGEISAGRELRSGYQINGEPLYDLEGLKKGNEWPYTEQLWSDAIAYIYFSQAGEKQTAAMVKQRIENKFGFDSQKGAWKGTDIYNPKSFYYGQTWMRFSLLLQSLGASRMLSGEKIR